MTWNKGRKHSEDSKKKISETIRNRNKQIADAIAATGNLTQFETDLFLNCFRKFQCAAKDDKLHDFSGFSNTSLTIGSSTTEQREQAFKMFQGRIQACSLNSVPLEAKILLNYVRELLQVDPQHVTYLDDVPHDAYLNATITPRVIWGLFRMVKAAGLVPKMTHFNDANYTMWFVNGLTIPPRPKLPKTTKIPTPSKKRPEKPPIEKARKKWPPKTPSHRKKIAQSITKLWEDQSFRENVKSSHKLRLLRNRDVPKEVKAARMKRKTSAMSKNIRIKGLRKFVDFNQGLITMFSN